MVETDAASKHTLAAVPVIADCLQLLIGMLTQATDSPC